MKYMLLFTCMSCLGSPRDSRELRIICRHLDKPHLERHDAFRIRRSQSLPHIFKTAQDTIIEIPHNTSETTIIEEIKSHHKEDKKESCCSKYKVVVWSAVITSGGVICASVMSAIVILSVHFGS